MKRSMVNLGFFEPTLEHVASSKFFPLRAAVRNIAPYESVYWALVASPSSPNISHAVDTYLYMLTDI